MAYSLVTHVEAGGSANGVTTGTVDTTGATLIVISTSRYSPAGESTTVSDSKGNTWTALTLSQANGVANRLYYCANPTVGSGHTFSTSDTGSYPSIAVLAFTGNTATPFDQENGGLAVATSLTIPSVTPTEDNELIVAGISHENNTAGSVTINGGFTAYTVAYSSGNSEGGGIAYLIQTTATAASPTWNITNSAAIAARIATFKAAAGGGGASVPVFVHHYRMQGIS